MLQFPSDWVQQFGANLITAYPEAGGGRFRYYERLRPQPSFSAIVNRMLASDPDFKVHQVGEMLRIVTAEGEYGAWVKIEGWREGTRARRYIGVSACLVLFRLSLIFFAAQRNLRRAQYCLSRVQILPTSVGSPPAAVAR